MQKIIIALLLIVCFAINCEAQKTTLYVFYTSGVPTGCFLGTIYVDKVTGNIYTYKVGVGCILSGNVAAPTGSGANGRVAFWNGTSSLSSDSGFTFDGTNDDLTLGRDLIAGRQLVGQFGTITPLSDLASLTLRRFSSGQTNYVFQVQTEANAFLAGFNSLGGLEVSSSIIPASAGLASLGSTTRPFSNIFLGTGTTTKVSITGSFTGMRTFTIVDANSNSVIPSTAGANQFANGIGSDGVITYAQPAFSNLSGSISASQIPNSTITNAMLTNSTISGISLGSNLADLVAGTGLSGSNYNGSVTRTFSVVADAGLPSQTSNSGKFLTTNGTISSWAAVDLSTKANTALDNLASVSINSAFLFQTGIDVGSTTKPARDIYLYGSGTYGTNYFRFTGTPTGTRVVSLPDLASYTLAQITNAQTFNGNQTYVNNILASVDGTPNIGAATANRFNVFAYSLSGNGASAAAGEWLFSLNNNAIRFTNGFLLLGSTVTVGFSSGNPSINTTDVGYCRGAAGQINVNDGTGTCTNYRDLGARTIKLGAATTRGTTEGTNKLSIFNGTAPAGTLTNGIDLFSNAGELHVLDAAGNDTLLSPHRKETNDWIYRSKNTVTGKNLEIDMERLMRALDRLLGGGYVREDSISALENNTFSPLFTDYLLRSSAINYFANIGGTQVLTPTAGTTVTITIDPTASVILASETAAQDQSLVISGTPQDGTRLTIIITNDGVLPRTITASTGLSALSTIVGITSKKSTISFIALNGTFIETARTVGI